MVNERTVKLYNYLVGAASIALLLALTIINGVDMPLRDIPLFLLMVVVEIIIDKFRIYTEKVSISFVAIIELASFLILGAVASAWVQLIFVVVTDYVIYKKPVRTVSINIGMLIGKIFFGALSYYYIIDLLGSTGGRYFSLGMILPAVTFMFCAFIFNFVLIYIQFTLVNNNILKKVIVNSAIWEGISILVSIPVAMEFTDIYKFSAENNLWFSILFILPFILSCYIFSLVKRIIFANTQLKALSKVALTINSYLDLEQTYNAVIDAISSLTTFTGCYIFDFDEKGKQMMPVAYRINDDSNGSGVYGFSIENSILGRVAASSEAIIFNDFTKERTNINESEYCSIYKSCILVPLRRLNKCAGCIGIFSDEERAYNTDILEFLMILSDQATIAIENAKLFKHSEEEAITDSLTYLYNQKYFYNYINRKIEEDSQNPGRMSLILFDIDHFKMVNDTYGHVIGDHVLKEVARIIKGSVRKNDVVARYGGEEFTVILPDLDSEGAFAIADRIRDRVENHVFLYDGHEIKLTISGGISEYPRTAANPIELVSYADRAMYVGAKFKGRNKVKIYDERLA